MVETPAYLAAAANAGMSKQDRETVVATVARIPTTGALMVGTGGCRKVRIAGRGKGKSGGYRVITFFAGVAMPVFLLTVFSKGEKADLTKGERNALAAVAKTIVATYGRRDRS